MYWASLSRNKKIISIDLRNARGRELVRQMVANCDVLLENFRPGTMEKWGLGYEDVSEINPGIVMVRVSGFGQTGPKSKRPGYGIVGEGLSGLRGLTGDPDRPPTRAAVPLTDYITGVYAALGVLLALFHRERTGAGQCVDAALYEAAFSVMDGLIPAYEKLGKVPMRAGSRLPGHAPNNLFPTGDNSYIQIAAGNTTTFLRLADAMARPDLKTDSRFASAGARNENCEELERQITAWTKQHTLRELDDILNENDVPAAPVFTLADIFQDDHYRAREMLLTVPSDELGTVTVPGVVPKLTATPGEVRWAGKPQGVDTRAVLSSLIGLDDIDIEKLESEKIIKCGGNGGHAS